MKRYFMLLIMAVSMCGCAAFLGKTAEPSYSRQKANIVPNNEIQARNLDAAKKFLQENRISAATDILVNICSAKEVRGVTDEAMFRLALLYLDGGQGKNDIAQAQHTLERLMKEYPGSSWSVHATSVIELIDDLNRKIKYLKGENLSLKGENLSLIKQNRELRINIEKLKILDIEQELKVKR